MDNNYALAVVLYKQLKVLHKLTRPYVKVLRIAASMSMAGKRISFENYSKNLENPLFVWFMNPEYEKNANWTLFDLQDKLMQSGWMVPAYSMPKDIEDVVVMRVVVRQGMSRDMADMLIGDISNAVAELDKLEYPTPSCIAARKSEKTKGKVYTH